ncbi:hypothetical protein [Absidia glauca]|uniref:Stress response protein NST1 n=1 Tax=Absidia glauca TaxID=4829 RepID=A0A168QWD5_ABSGL|nr:hypothetical protein [Absidia glauca]
MAKNTTGAIDQSNTSHHQYSTNHMAAEHRPTNDDIPDSGQLHALTVIATHCLRPIQQEAATTNTSTEFATPSPHPVNNKGKRISKDRATASSTPANSDDIWTDNSKNEERQKVREFWQQQNHLNQRSLFTIEQKPVAQQKRHRHRQGGQCSNCSKKKLWLKKEIQAMYEEYCKKLQVTPDPLQPDSAPQCSSCPTDPTTSAHVTSSHGISRTLQNDQPESCSNPAQNPSTHSNSKTTAKAPLAGTGAVTDPSQMELGSSIEKALVITDDLIKTTGHKFLDLVDHLLKAPTKQDTTRNSKGKTDNDSEKNTTIEGILKAVCDREDTDAVNDDDDDDDGASSKSAGDQETQVNDDIILLFIAKMFEERVTSAYREKVAKQRQERFIQELDEEDRDRKKRQLQKQIEKAQKKEARRLLMQQKEDERLAEENQQKAYEEAKRLERARKDEIGRLKQDAERKRKQEECKRKDDKRRRFRSKARKKGKCHQQEQQRHPPLQQQQQLIQYQPKKLRNSYVNQVEDQHSNSPMMDLNKSTITADDDGRSPPYIPSHAGTTPNGSSFDKDYSPSLLMDPLPSSPEQVFRLDSGTLYPFDPHATDSDTLSDASVSSTRPRKPSVSVIGIIGDSLHACKRQSIPPTSLPALFGTTDQHYVDMLISPPGMCSLDFLLERLEPPDYHSTQRLETQHLGPDLRPSATMVTGLKISQLCGCFTNWASGKYEKKKNSIIVGELMSSFVLGCTGWDASDAVTNEISANLFDDRQVTPDRQKQIMGRVDKVYPKAGAIDQKSMVQSTSPSSSRSSCTLTHLHQMLSDTNNDEAVNIRELQHSLNSSGLQHGLQCTYSHDHQDHLVSHTDSPRLPPKEEPQEQVTAQAAPVYYLPTFIGMVPSSLPAQGPRPFLNTGASVRFFSLPGPYLQYIHMPSSPFHTHLYDCL